ncbi:MAG: tRNA (adenosine(37)-N6)-dimethylallyltransferase MiaA [Candidatus Sungbacteria bacterium]|nr:tRNA (adenosine(37)-N6)-dimethylallyltransferase MiaA [Candidatus Sungbacteria bacterium]
MPPARKPKLIVILGPTASGKSALAVKLAKKFRGEVISADSRQIYKGLNIGTGKITKREMRGVPHHLLDIVSPRQNFSAAEYAKKAHALIREINKRNRIPMLVGGTGLYIDAVARGMVFPEVPPNHKLRKKLSKKGAAGLFKMLKRLDPERAATIDRQNPRRLIRALEIVEALKKPVPILQTKSSYQTLFIGIDRTLRELRRRIRRAIETRLKRGLLRETARLLKQDVPAKRLGELGLDYRIAITAIKKEITRDQLSKKLEEANWNYIRRQQTWFRRHRDIHWIKNETEAERLIKRFLAR